MLRFEVLEIPFLLLLKGRILVVLGHRLRRLLRRSRGSGRGGSRMLHRQAFFLGRLSILLLPSWSGHRRVFGLLCSMPLWWGPGSRLRLTKRTPWSFVRGGGKPIHRRRRFRMCLLLLLDNRRRCCWILSSLFELLLRAPWGMKELSVVSKGVGWLRSF